MTNGSLQGIGMTQREFAAENVWGPIISHLKKKKTNNKKKKKTDKQKKNK